MLRKAAELGVQFFDSARAYGPEWVDKIIADTLHLYSKEVFIATKGCVDKIVPGRIVVDGSASTIASQIDSALENLEVDHVDLFQLHRVDPKVLIEKSVGAIEKARQQGKVRFIGLSNVNKVQLDRTLAVAPIASVQNRFNQTEASDAALVDYTASLDIAYIPYGPLGAHPMRRGAALPAQSAIAWLLNRSPNIIVIPGTTSIEHLKQNVNAWQYI